ncbi:hypothetical protein [Streptomyces murinus]|uniref:hypothetical protein n=1 Tax=Streptomyces murinus TaxID=33900 RepID=UPI0018F403C6|nr:hypothetical protein [Streptomyces murinus]
MTALPGQRAAQRPYRAMVASQRALGRAAQAANGALVGPIGVAFIDGQQYDVDLSAPPDQQLRPVEPPCVCTCRCPCPCASTGEHGRSGTKKQERQG